MPKKRCDAHKILLPLFASALGSFLFGCSSKDASTESTRAAIVVLPGPPALTSITPLTRPEGLDREKVALGRELFNDQRLSADGSISCAGCHDIASGGDDGRPTAIGIGGASHELNTPTVLNSAMNIAQSWDGRAHTLEEQIDHTVRSPIEMGADWSIVEQRLRSDEGMSSRFEGVYSAAPSAERIIDALAEYLRALVTVGAPFDRYLAGDKSAIGPEATEGYQLFLDLGCISCHQGRNLGGNFFQRIGVMENYFALRGGEVRSSDLGRYNVTGREEDRFKFKVPGLRNVTETAPYFHDGSAKTLEDAVHTMIKVQLGRPIREDEIRKLVAFLESLSGAVEESLL